MWFWRFLVALLPLFVYCQSQCPTDCNCHDGVLSCHTDTGEKLKTVPPKLYLNDLSMITEIDFEGSDIDQLHVGDFTGLGNVKVLNMNRNKLKVLLQGHFNGLRQVRQIWLTENSIRFLDSYVFSGLPNLHEVDLSRNQLEYIPRGTFRTAGSNAHSPILTLELMNNNLNVLTAGMFDGLTKLKSLYLDYNDIESIEANTFTPLVSLQILSLRNVNLKPTIFLPALQRLPALNEIYLSGNLFPCNCDWLDLKNEVESSGAQIRDLSSTPTCGEEQSLVCQKLREHPSSRETHGYQFITLRELTAPKVEKGKMTVHGKWYKPSSVEGEEALLQYDTETRERIQELPDENKRNFYLRIFQSRMEDFIQKHVLAPEKKQNLIYVSLYEDVNTSIHHSFGLSHIDARGPLRRQSLHMVHRTKNIIAMVTPLVIILFFFVMVCFCRMKGTNASAESQSSKCFEPIIRCLQKLKQRKEYTQAREGKLQERIEFRKLHGQVKESIDRPKNIFAKKAAEEIEMEAHTEEDFRSTLQKQRKMSLGGTRFSSSSEGTDDEDDEVVFDKREISK